MSVILLVILGSLVAGVARGGTMTNLSELPFRSARLLLAAVVVQLLGASAEGLGLPRPGLLYVLGMVGSAALVTVFVARNRALPGMALIVLGFVLNAIVVTANGAMPVDPKAAERVGIDTIRLYQNVDAKHELADSATRLRFLADVIPVPLPWPFERGSNVVSIGDVVLAAGIGVLLVNGMLGVRERGEPKHVRPA